MTFSINFSNKPWISVCIFLAGMVCCPQPVSAQPEAPVVDTNAPIAVFPIENLSGDEAPLMEIRESLVRGLKARGMRVIDEAAMEQFKDRFRLRYLGGITAETGRALRSETGAAAVLISVVELYTETPSPRIGLMCRLVETGEKPTILWMESVGLTGEDSPGILGLGIVSDPHKIVDNAVGVLAGSLASFRAGKKPQGKKVNSDNFRPQAFYRSSALGLDFREVKAAFPLRTSWIEGTADPAKLYVTLSSASARRVTVDYAAISGTAREGDKADYQFKPGTLVFEPGETFKAIKFKLMNAGSYDSDKTVEVMLSNAVNAVLGDTRVHTINIVNTKPMPAVAFSAPSQSVKENAGTAAVMVKLSAASGKDVTVPFTVEGPVNAAGKSNYRVVTPSPLVIKAGSAGGEIAVELIDNGLQEDDKTIVLSLGIPTNAALGNQTVSTLTVVDNDPSPVVTFAQTTSRGEERVSPAKLTVSMNAASGKKVTVDYAVTGGTALGGVEYVLKGGTLVFKPGETVKTVELDILPKAVYKDDKTIEVTLSNPKNAVLGEAKTHVYTVVNTAPMPSASFSAASQSVKENAGTAAVMVKLSAVSGKDMTVPFTVEGPAKAAGRSDYRVVTPSPLVVRAGRSFADITMIIEDNRLPEDDKTIIVTLGTPTHAVSGVYPRCTITIKDNDARPSVSVTPFFNDSKREDAGELLTLHFLKNLLASDRFSLIELGEVRQLYLNTRVILRAGMNIEKADIIANVMKSDLLFTGTVVNFQDSLGPGGRPGVDFSVAVIERTGKKVVWTSRSYKTGSDNVVLFDWGKVLTADELASKMSHAVVNMLIN